MINLFFSLRPTVSIEIHLDRSVLKKVGIHAGFLVAAYGVTTAVDAGAFGAVVAGAISARAASYVIGATERRPPFGRTSEPRP